MHIVEFEHYGESLDSTPGFFLLKKHWQEDQLSKELSNFVDTPFPTLKDRLKELNIQLLKTNQNNEYGKSK